MNEVSRAEESVYIFDYLQVLLWIIQEPKKQKV
jgi:hypothetical protein